MCLSLAAYALIVVYDNIVDYGSNFTFVGHVMSMDTTFPDNALRSRSIDNPTIWHIAYWIIILAETATCALLLIGSWHLWKARAASGAQFNKAKGVAIMGATAGFLVWFTAIMIVCGEWFSMWQSATWNGQQPASRIYLAVIGVLIFLNQSDVDIAEA
jgi:predicted small integral membrane protein